MYPRYSLDSQWKRFKGVDGRGALIALTALGTLGARH